jgi:hypothetical protein
MKQPPTLTAFLVVLALSSPTAVLGAQPNPASSARSQSRQEGTFVKGTVVEIFGPRLFSLREGNGQGQELLVLAPREIATAPGATVAVSGTLHRVDDRELRQVRGSSELSPQLRTRFAGRPILIATGVLSSTEARTEAGQTGQPEEQPAEPPKPLAPAAPASLPLPASTLVEFIQTFAGQAVRIQNARVVGLITPGVFLIEPATRYLKDMGQRDRMAVFVESGHLRVDPELLVGSIVELEGTVRTVLSLQAAGDVQWPSKLTQQVVDRLEIRAAVVATSVHTSEGTELTERPAGSSKYQR